MKPLQHPRLRPLASNWHHEPAPQPAPSTLPGLSRASLARLNRLASLDKDGRTLASVAPIPASGTWSVDRPEPRKIFMPYSPPRFKMTRNGPREEKWLMVLETVTVTVTVPRGSYTLTTTNRGNSVLDSRDESRRPLPEVRRELTRVLGATHADAACEELATNSEGHPLMRLRGPKAQKVRAVTAADHSRMEAARNSWEAIEAEQARRRAERKANSPAKDEAPDFAAMTAEEFAEFNARTAKEAAQAISWVQIDDRYGCTVERVREPREMVFPAPFAE